MFLGLICVLVWLRRWFEAQTVVGYGPIEKYGILQTEIIRTDADDCERPLHAAYKILPPLQTLTILEVYLFIGKV